jgi:RNase P/RNase MRP subunit p29
MHWPDIFFKARKPRPDPALPPPFKPAAESPKPALADAKPQPPTIKPVPAALRPQTAAPPAPPTPASIAATTPPPVKIAPVETGTRTLPAMHGVVLRPPARLATGALPIIAPASSARLTAPLKNIEQLMAEADPVHTLRQTGNLRMLKRLTPESARIKAEPGPSSAASPPPEPPKADPAPAAVSPPVSTEAPEPEETPFILKSAAAPASVPKIIPPAPPTHPPLMPFGSIFRRKAKMTDLARIVLPPKREEQPEPPPAPAESSPTVVPPAFPIAGAAHGSITTEVPRTDSESPQPTVTETTSPAPEPTPGVEAKPVAPLPDEPKVDPEAHKPESSATPLPKIDPEAHKPAPPPAAPVPSTELSARPVMPEKREFHLANGEHVVGTVLSETPEAVYVDHGTLGVLTIPRAQIAKRLVEIILINGDRIVGDIMAETADTLYVRHASLGMLTVPRAQRSTRVVEAILKDGDRILGEVLTETESFTVIRSATLGTITVPHNKISMLNRKIEQIEMKALPLPAPELKDKPAG